VLVIQLSELQFYIILTGWGRKTRAACVVVRGEIGTSGLLNPEFCWCITAAMDPTKGYDAIGYAAFDPQGELKPFKFKRR